MHSTPPWHPKCLASQPQRGDPATAVTPSIRRGFQSPPAVGRPFRAQHRGVTHETQGVALGSFRVAPLGRGSSPTELKQECQQHTVGPLETHNSLSRSYGPRPYRGAYVTHGWPASTPTTQFGFERRCDESRSGSATLARVQRANDAESRRAPIIVGQVSVVQFA